MDKRHWVYSDPHFNHKNIIEYGERPFTDLEEMQEVLIRRYNELVANDDIVYWLGDVGFCSKEIMTSIITRMHGYKILIMGNHDWHKSRNWFLDAGFTEVTKYPIIVRNQLILSHQPMPMSDDYTYFNIHGHVHQDTLDSQFHFNASVEVTEYRPVLLDKIEQVFYTKKKNYKR